MGYPPAELDGHKITIEKCCINKTAFRDSNFDREAL